VNGVLAKVLQFMETGYNDESHAVSIAKDSTDG